MFLIDKEFCIGCGQCVEVCPADAITLQNAIAVIDQAACRQCGMCADKCPAQAISEDIPTYAKQAEQRASFSQQRSGMFAQILDGAGRFLAESFRHIGKGGSGGRGGHAGRGGFRGGRR